MAPQTRKSQASSSQEQPTASTQHIDIPADISTDDLGALLGAADWTAPTRDNILSVYRLILQQKHDYDNAFRDWEERLAQKDAEVEQALHDQESFRVESTEQIDALRSEIESLNITNDTLEKDRAALQAQLATLSSSTSESGAEVQQLKFIVEEREKEKKNLTDALDGALSRETRLHSKQFARQNSQKADFRVKLRGKHRTSRGDPERQKTGFGTSGNALCYGICRGNTKVQGLYTGAANQSSTRRQRQTEQRVLGTTRSLC